MELTMTAGGAVRGGGISGPPWEAPNEYVADSPLFFADRIVTPLLFMAGDVDPGVSPTQSEEMFAAMWRQGKRARFVRYMGEGHTISTYPENVRHMEHQLMAWFDEFGDIARDDRGNIIWENGRAKSRSGRPPLRVEDYSKFDPARRVTP